MPVSSVLMSATQGNELLFAERRTDQLERDRHTAGGVSAGQYQQR